MHETAAHPTAEQLSAFGLGKLGDADTEVVARHLTACDRCRKAVEEQPPDSLLGLLGAVKHATIPPAAHPARAASVSPRPAADLPPELANHTRYEFEKVLGQGGMGTVYRARHRQMNRTVAIKVIARGLVDRPEAIARFNREIRAAGSLIHSNIVTAFDADQAGDLHLLVMEYVDGQSLAEVLERHGPLPVAHACHYVRQAALGLQHAAEQGMVHRDLKPQNLMLTAKGMVKILDFGLAALASERGVGKGLTAEDAVMGTPEYLSPEQALDARQADVRADIYSLGCTLYCLLAGQPPFPEGTALQRVMAHLNREARPLPEIRPDVPAELWSVVAKMLAKEPAARQQTPTELAQALLPFVKSGSKKKPERLAASPGSPSLPGADTSKVLSLKSNTLDTSPNAVPLAQPVAVEAIAQAANDDFGSLTSPRPTLAGASRRPKPQLAGRWMLPRRTWALIGGGLAAAILLLGLIFTIRTKDGTIEIRLSDPQAKVDVQVDGETIHLTTDETTLTLRAGEHQLLVQGPGYETWSDKFTVKRGERDVLTVALKKTPKAPPPEWVPLFNGKDTTGWKSHSTSEAKWEVKDGILIGSGSTGYLFNDGKSYENFHLRVEAMINDGGNSGVYFRTLFDPGQPVGPCAQIDVNSECPIKTGSLMRVRNAVNLKKSPVNSGEWFMLEVIADGPHLVLKVNGQVTADYVDKASEPVGGQIALEVNDADTVVKFRKIEIKELPAMEAVKIDPKLRRAHKTYCGHWKIEGDELVQDALMPWCDLVFGDFTWKDYDFTADVKRTGGNDAVALLYRVSGAGRSVFVLGAEANKVDWVVSWQRGSRVELDRHPGGIEQDQWYKLRVRLRGAHCQCFVDGKMVFDREDEKNLQGMIGFETFCSALRFKNIRVTDPDGKVLFAGLPELPATASQWPPATEPASPSELRCLIGHGAPVTSVAFSRDGRQVLSASDGETDGIDTRGQVIHYGFSGSRVRLWNTQTGKELDCSPPANPFWTNWAFRKLAIAPDAPIVLSFTHGYYSAAPVQLWEITGDQLEPRFRFPEKILGIIDLSVAPDGRNAVALDSAGSLWEWDLKDRKLVRHLPGNLKDVTCTAIAPDGRLALLARRNQPFAEIDLSNGKETGRWKDAAGGVRCLAFAPNSRLSLAGGEDGTVRVWDIVAGKSVHRFSGHHKPVRAVAISPDGRRALSGSDDQTVKLWDLENKKELACFTGHTSAVQAVAFSPDGLVAASGSADYTVRLWRLPATKSEALAATGAGDEEKGFVPLFNGKDLTGWTALNDRPAEWAVHDGFMEVTPRKGDIITKEKFGPDFQLHAEFWLPLMPNAKGQARANSGIFLQGRYEVQILDSFMNGTHADGSIGALYGLIAPDAEALQKAIRPPEQWQTYDITFHAPRVDVDGKVTDKGRITIDLNGVTVIKDGRFDKAARGALDNKLGDAGPIRLQDHGAKVRFRKIEIKELPPGPVGPPPEIERHAAEWVLSLGGSVVVRANGQERNIAGGATLPAEGFVLEQINLDNKPFIASDLKRLEGLTNLKRLHLDNTGVDDAGWARLKGLLNLSELNLSRNPISDAGLEHLKGLTNLTGLYLFTNRRVGDAGLRHLEGLTNLNNLDLNATGVTDAGVIHLEGLTKLRWLNLMSTRVTGAAFIHLKGMTRLEALFLFNNKVDDAGLAHLKGLTELSHLGLVRTQVGDAGLAHLEGLTKLSILNLDGTRVSDAGLVHLQPLTKLTALELRRTGVSGAGLAHLVKLNNLERLYLTGCGGIWDKDLPALQGLSKLRTLDLSETWVTPSGVVALQKLLPKCHITPSPDARGEQTNPGIAPAKPVAKSKDPAPPAEKATEAQLRQRIETAWPGLGNRLSRDNEGNYRLNLRRCGKQVTDLSPLKDMKLTFLDCGYTSIRDLSPLKDMKLTTLICWHAPVNDAGLMPLQGMSSLRRLELVGLGMTDAGLVHLEKLTDLEILNCGRMKWTGTGLVHLKGMTRLQFLSLFATEVTDAGLVHLKGLLSLRELHLHGTRATDAGLEYLAGLKNLAKLHLNGTAVTDKGVAKLKAALPKCNIQR